MSENTEPNEFEGIYLQTNYIVQDGESRFVFRIGETNVDELLNRYQAESWAFITAYNPYSEQLSSAENVSRQSELVELVKSKNLKFLEGFGECTTPDWEHEICLFIFNIELNLAIEFAKKYQQNAIVYGELGGVPQLIWCL
jgi:Protein of unknown function (DUF3293)